MPFFFFLSLHYHPIRHSRFCTQYHFRITTDYSCDTAYPDKFEIVREKQKNQSKLPIGINRQLS